MNKVDVTISDKIYGQTKGQKNIDNQGKDKSEILSIPGVSQAEDYLEKGFHCRICNSELTNIEKSLYGDICLFHTKERVLPYSIVRSLYDGWLNAKLYYTMIEFKHRFTDTSFWFMTSVLGLLGLQNIGSAYNIKLK